MTHSGSNPTIDNPPGQQGPNPYRHPATRFAVEFIGNAIATLMLVFSLRVASLGPYLRRRD